MNNQIRIIVCATALVVLPVHARGDDLSTPASGKLLVLDNERTIEGEIDRHEGQYRVHRPVGELWIPAENVLHLCNTKEEAYAFLRTRANLRDPDEHIRLAHWCQARGLKTQAVQEAREAVELRPNPASRRLLQNLEHAAVAQHTASSTRPSDEKEPLATPPEVDTESLSLFVTRVQPTLMNACAACHATGRGGAFKLTRVYEHGQANRRTTYQNLAAALNELNRDQYQQSPLLVKAATIHGDMSQPAIKTRETDAYRSLEQWARITVESKQVARRQTQETPKPEPASPQQVGTPSPTPAEPVDPYDPLIFNRQAHPKR